MRRALLLILVPALLPGPAAAATCDPEVVAARSEELAPKLGRPAATVNDGVVVLEYHAPEPQMRAVMAIQLENNQVFTATSTSAMPAELGAAIDALAPDLALDPRVLPELTRCEAGSLDTTGAVQQWEAEIRSFRAPASASASAGPRSSTSPWFPGLVDSIGGNRSSPWITLGSALAALALCLVGLFGWRRRGA